MTNKARRASTRNRTIFHSVYKLPIKYTAVTTTLARHAREISNKATVRGALRAKMPTHNVRSNCTPSNSGFVYSSRNNALRTGSSI